MFQNNLLKDIIMGGNKNDGTENTELETDEIKDMKDEIENLKNEIEDIQMEIEDIEGDNKEEPSDKDDILIKSSNGASDQSKYLDNENIRNEIKEIGMEIEYIKSEVNDNNSDNIGDITTRISSDTSNKSKDKFKEICMLWYGDKTPDTEIKKETNKIDVIDEIDNEIEYIGDENNKNPVNIVSDIVDRPKVIYFAPKKIDTLTDDKNDITNKKAQQIFTVLYNEATGDNNSNDNETGKLNIVKLESGNNLALDKTNDTDNLEEIYSVYDDDTSVGETVQEKPYVRGTDKMHTIKSALEMKYRKIQEKLQNKFKTSTNMKRNKEVVIKMINDIDQVRKECLRNFDDIQEAQEVAQFLDKIKGEMEDLLKEKCDSEPFPKLEYNKTVILEHRTSNNDLSEKKSRNCTPQLELENKTTNTVLEIRQKIKDEGFMIKFNPIKGNSKIRKEIELNKMPKLEYNDIHENNEMKNKTDTNHDIQEKRIMIKFNPIKEKDYSSVIPKTGFNLGDGEIVLRFNPIKKSDLKREKNKYNHRKQSEYKHSDNLNEIKTGLDVCDEELVMDMEFNPIKIYNLTRERVECNQIPKLNIVMRFNQIKNLEQTNEKANNSSGNSCNSIPQMDIQDEWLMINFNPIKDYDLTREKVECNQIPKLNVAMRFNEIKSKEQEQNCIPSIGQTIQDDWLLVKFNPIRNYDQVKENIDNYNGAKESRIEIKFNPIKDDENTKMQSQNVNSQKRKSYDELNMNVKGHKADRLTRSLSSGRKTE